MDHNKRTSVLGIYVTRTQAEAGADALIHAGFSRDDVSVLMQQDASTREFAHEKHTKAPEGTTTGVAAGGAVGGTLGLLAGIGAIAIPGLGAFIAAGPIMATLAGVGAGGAVGGVIGALSGMGIPEYEAKRFEGRLKQGGILLSVHCDTSDDLKTAKDMLKMTGAEDISSTGEEKSDDTSSSRAENGYRSTQA
jgi:hypothetical protein